MIQFVINIWGIYKETIYVRFNNLISFNEKTILLYI